MNIIFWFCWSVEVVLTIWWLFQDLKLTYLKLNPFITLSFLYLALVMLIRLGLNWTRVSDAMVLIPAIPLVGLLLIITVHAKTGGRWN